MAFLVWTDTLSVGVLELDNQHKRLVALINELNEAMKVGKSKDTLHKIFDDLVNYTIHHFSYEESLLQKASYVNYATHKREHDELTKKVKVLRDDFLSGKMMISIEVRDFLKEWILNHIQKTDKMYSSALNEYGIK